jgi:hypothetical protein
MISREQRDVGRENWVREMGLSLRHRLPVKDTAFFSEVRVYEWPKADGRQYDRDVIMLVYEDGSWATALDDGTINLEQSKQALQAMALAAETTKEN